MMAWVCKAKPEPASAQARRCRPEALKLQPRGERPLVSIGFDSIAQGGSAGDAFQSIGDVAGGLLRHRQMSGLQHSGVATGDLQNSARMAVTLSRQFGATQHRPSEALDGVFPQTGQEIRRKAAQMAAGCAYGLVNAAHWGSVVSVDGEIIPLPSANLLNPTPSLVGQVSEPYAGLPDFSCSVRSLQNRRRFAHPRIPVGNSLRQGAVTGFVPLSVKNKKQGWAGCEQQRSLPPLHFAQALQPAAIQPANRPSMARGRGISARSSLMATRCLAPPQGLRPTCFIARQVRASAADPLARQSFPDNRLLLGPDRHVQRAVRGHSTPGGAVRLQHLKLKEA